MDRIWVDKRNEKAANTYFDGVAKISAYISSKRAENFSFDDYREKDILEIIAQATIAENDRSRVDLSKLYLSLYGFLAFNDEVVHDLDALYGEGFSRRYAELTPFNPNAYDIYLSETFDLDHADYIVTDPCYIELPWDFNSGEAEPARFWDDEFKAAMPSLRMRDTLYGDWGCTVFDVTEKDFDEMGDEERINAVVGRFCADAGMVCVVRYDEVAAYNPKFIEELEAARDTQLGSLHACVIRDFAGKCSFDVVEEKYEHDGKIYTDYTLHVAFEGEQAGRPVKFESIQTSL